jgi:hypothetical protein
MEISCPHCQQSVDAQGMGGRTVACPHCRKTFIVPRAAGLQAVKNASSTRSSRRASPGGGWLLLFVLALTAGAAWVFRGELRQFLLPPAPGSEEVAQNAPQTEATSMATATPTPAVRIEPVVVAQPKSSATPVMARTGATPAATPAASPSPGLHADDAWRNQFKAGAAQLGSAMGASASGTPDLSEKKGWGGDLPAAEKLRARWYYNWGPGGPRSERVEFVPMVKGKWHVNPRVLASIKASGAATILCFNEPERADQGNTTVEEALDLWPQLMATGLRLGGPAPSSDGKGMAWLMAEVEKRRLRVDFIALHWYRSSDPKELETWLDAMHRKYRRPIWLTEFNAQYSGGDRERFAERSWKILRRLRYVERFAYFTPSPGKPASLYADRWGGDLTPLGQKYAEQ